MPVAGDLATIDLADLLQNMEANRRTGTLRIQDGDGVSLIFFRAGAISMFASESRPPLPDLLVAAGYLTHRRIENARKKFGASRKPLVAQLVAKKAISGRRLKEAAEDLLFEGVADLVASATGSFDFEESEDPPDGFDSNEACLGLRVPVSHLVLEATRRADHWVLIRKFIPSPHIYFVARDKALCPTDVEDPELGQQILSALDGTRSVRDVEELFPTRRFLVNKIMADFVRDRLARAVESSDLAKVASRLAVTDIKRARTVVSRGLEGEPHHPGLLELEADLAAQMRDASSAARALKMLAHLETEAGHIDEALERLERAKLLTPNDPAIWERTLTLAIQQGRRRDALAEGMTLVEFHRAPGLHGKAKEVLDRLIKLEPASVELRVEHGRTQVDMGESHAAVRGLLRYAKGLVSEEKYISARTVFSEILNIEPKNKEASLSIELIDKETFARRRERKRRICRILLAAAVTALLGTLLFLEVSARLDYVALSRQISRDRLIEHERYEDVIRLLEDLRLQHPISATAWYDVRQQLQDLQASARRRGLPRPR